VRGQTENGAKFNIFGGANKAVVAGRAELNPATGWILNAQPPFFVSFFGRTKKEKKGFGQAKEPERSGARRRQMNK
jgi:hypothetical protein